MDRQNKQKKYNYAFIDSQNLNLGIQRAGFKMDWKKFRAYLKDEHNVEKAFMFIGYLPEYEDLYKQMHDHGYLIVLKPTLEMYADPEQEKKEDKPPTKGNVDAELVMYAMKEMSNYKQALIVSGDGDFFSLIEYLENKGRLKNIMTPNWKYSTLLKPYEKYIIRLDEKRKHLEYKDRKYRKKSTKSKGSKPTKRKPSNRKSKKK
jgi:uncharacterized LabA/DUF88 family protein